MDAKIVAITKPLITRIVDGVDKELTPEEFLVYCARVSNPANQLNLDTAPKLLKYCLDHHHYSVFEQASFTVEVETSLAIATQFIRHNSMRFQQFSQRYATNLKMEVIELRKQSTTNRQSSTELLNNPELDAEVQQHLDKSIELYKKLIDAGVARECARFVLPTATSTHLYVTGNVRSWIHYLMARDAEDTQKEHSQLAQLIKEEFIRNFPNIAEAVGWK